MTDASLPPAADSEPSPAADHAAGQGQGHEVEVDLAAFLPEGVELGDDAAPGVVASSEAGGGSMDVPRADAPPAPAVDTEALSQIERDLDAVDAAIAALDAGTYGLDPASGQPIDDAVLAANPTHLG